MFVTQHLYGTFREFFENTLYDVRMFENNSYHIENNTKYYFK